MANGSPSVSAFRHTAAVLQTPEALERVAGECAADLAADGVIYAEVRFAPEAHTKGLMSLDDAIEAVLSGLTAPVGSILRIGLICTALRHEARSTAVAEAAVRWQTQGVVGFDLAGPEHGYPIDRHAPAVRHAKEHGLGITLHAGEGAGVESIEAAVDLGATRIGHGVRIIEDIDTALNPMRLGDVAALLLRSHVALEICPTSNVHTRVAASIAAHPAKTLLDAGLAVTINTDNRLISGVSATGELASLVEHQLWDWRDLESVTDNAIDASYQERKRPGANPIAHSALVPEVRQSSSRHNGRFRLTLTSPRLSKRWPESPFPDRDRAERTRRVGVWLLRSRGEEEDDHEYGDGGVCCHVHDHGIAEAPTDLAHDSQKEPVSEGQDHTCRPGWEPGHMERTEGDCLGQDCRNRGEECAGAFERDAPIGGLFGHRVHGHEDHHKEGNRPWGQVSARLDEVQRGFWSGG